MSPRPLVLASASPYRARLLAEAGIETTSDAPEVDERALDADFDRLGPPAFALALAHLKADAVAPRHSDAVLIAADQVGVLHIGGVARQLTKQDDEDSAVAQLVSMSNSTHELINALVVADTGTGQRVDGIDRQRVTMRRFSEREARAYVRRFEPYDSSGSYRLEDQEDMAPADRFVTQIDGEDASGVLGLPMPLLERLLDQIRT